MERVNPAASISVPLLFGLALCLPAVVSGATEENGVVIITSRAVREISNLADLTSYHSDGFLGPPLTWIAGISWKLQENS